MGAEFVKVFRCWVAFMLRKSILGIQAVEDEHRTVTLDFGDDARGSNPEAQAVPTDKSRVRRGEIRHGQPIDEGMRRPGSKLQKCGSHAGVSGSKNVEAVDLSRSDVDRGSADGGVSGEFEVECVSAEGGEFFGVIEAGKVEFEREDDGGANQRTGKRPPTGFVNTGDGMETESGELFFVIERAGHAMSCAGGSLATTQVPARMGLKCRASRGNRNTPKEGVFRRIN
jgi:hypothetical protein